MTQESHDRHRTLQSAVRSRDRAVTRVRRLTAAIGLVAAVAASGLGVLIASEPVAHSATDDGGGVSTTTGAAGTSSPSAAPTSSASGTSTSSATSGTATTGSSVPTVTSPTTTAPATTVSGQS
jgi:hypothetical protein